MHLQQKQGSELIYGKKSTYKIETQIAEGSGGMVYLGKDIKSQGKVAIKIQNQMGEDEKQISELFSQKQFKHLVNIFEFFQTPDRAYVIIMDYCNSGDLNEYLQNQRLDYQSTKQLFKQIVEGVHELHNLDYMHRDLKPENILVFIDEQTKFVTLKVQDYGLAKKEDIARTMNIGTPYYMAPELIGGQQTQIDSSIDIWALGCIWYEMLSNQLLFDGKSEQELCQRIKSTKQEWIDKQIDGLVCCGQNVDDQDKKLLKRMICVDKTKRLDAQKILQTLNGKVTHIQDLGQSTHFKTKPIQIIRIIKNDTPKQQQDIYELQKTQAQAIKQKEKELRQELSYQHRKEIQEIKEKQEKEQQELIKQQEIQRENDKKVQEEKLRKQKMNEELIQYKLKELEKQKEKKLEEKLKIESSKQEQELREFNRKQDEIMKQKLQEQEINLRKVLEEKLRKEQENEIQELKTKNEQEQRVKEEQYKKQLEELEIKSKEKQDKTQAQLELLEIEKTKLKKQFQQDKINKQKEQIQKEEQLKQALEKKQEEYQQQYLQRLRNEVTQKKTKYERFLQQFEVDQKDILNQFQTNEANLNQFQLKVLEFPKLNISQEQVELEKQIKQIDEQFETLSQLNLACIQRKIYFNSESEINNDKNKYYQGLKVKINELKQSLKVLSNQEIQDVEESLQKYKQEEFEQKIIQDKDKQIQQLQQESQQKQLKWQINYMNNQLKEQKQKYEQGLSQFQDIYKNVLPKLQNCFDFQQLRLNLQDSQDNGDLQQQIDQLTQKIMFIEGKQELLNKINLACQQRKSFFEFEDNLNHKNPLFTIIKQEIEKLKHSIELLQNDQFDYLDNLMKQYNQEELVLKELEYNQKINEEVQKQLEFERQKQQLLIDQHQRNLDEEVQKQVSLQRSSISQQLQDKHNNYQNKLNQYFQQVEMINHNLQKDFKGLLGINSLEYQQFEISKHFLKELQKIAQLYQTELRQYENKGDKQKIEQNEEKYEEQLKEVEQQLEAMILKQGQIKRDQERLEELKQQLGVIQQEYSNKINEEQNQIQLLEEQIKEGYKRKLESYETQRGEFKKNKYCGDEETDKEFKQLTDKLNQEQEKLKEQCKLQQQLQLQQTLEEQIILHDQLVRIIKILQEKELEFKAYDEKKYFQEFKDNLIFKPTRQKEYSMNKVKLRAKIKDQVLIREILRIQDLKENNYQQIIKDILLSRYDELMKQINI